MDPNHLFTLFIEVMIVMLAVSVHEATHAWVSLRLGDATAAEQGHATLNPLPHFDVFGTLVLPSLLAALGGQVFGWGRPAPLDVSKLRRPDRDDVKVILSGVLANALLAIAAVIALIVAARWAGEEGKQAALLSLQHRTDEAAKLAGFPLMFTLARLATINGFLVLFNLLPFPPLDGGRLAMIFLPPDWGQSLLTIRPYPRTVLVILSAFVISIPFLILFVGTLGVILKFS